MWDVSTVGISPTQVRNGADEGTERLQRLKLLKEIKSEISVLLREVGIKYGGFGKVGSGLGDTFSSHFCHIAQDRLTEWRKKNVDVILGVEIFCKYLWKMGREEGDGGKLESIEYLRKETLYWSTTRF